MSDHARECAEEIQRWYGYDAEEFPDIIRPFIAAAVESETAELRAKLQRAIELADDLRDYTHYWDFKYGEFWDAERNAL